MSRSLPATPIGRFARHTWESLAQDEGGGDGAAPSRQQPPASPPRRFPASSPPSPLRAGRLLRPGASYRPLYYDRVDLIVRDPAEGCGIGYGDGSCDENGELPPPDEDDEAVERLLMLLSLPENTTSVSEILRATAECYSVQLSQHAALGGDSLDDVASLFPAALRAALAAFLERPAVREVLDGGGSGTLDKEQHQAILALLSSLSPAPPTDREDATASGTVPTDDDDDKGEVEWDPAAPLEDGEEEDDDEDEDEVGDARHVSRSTARAQFSATDDARGNGDAQLPAWARRAAPLSASVEAAPPRTMLALHELGWAMAEDAAIDAAKADGAAFASRQLGKHAMPSTMPGGSEDPLDLMARKAAAPQSRILPAAAGTSASESASGLSAFLQELELPGSDDEADASTRPPQAGETPWLADSRLRADYLSPSPQSTGSGSGSTVGGVVPPWLER